MDDKTILALFEGRDEEALRACVEKYSPYCGRIARNMLGPEEAEECLNDTWLAAWNSIPPQKPAVLSAYLGKITRRLAIKRWRAASAQKRGGGEMALALEDLGDCVAGTDDAEQALETKELVALLEAFVRGLPDTERRLFLGRYWELTPVAALAKSFGFTESKVKSMLWRSRQKLRRALIREGFLDEK